MGNETAKALRAMAARVGSGEPKLAALTRDLQDVTRRRTTTRALLAEEMTRPAEQREAREEDLKRQLREAEEKAEALETQLQAEFPRYARLTAERPLTADEVQALLRPEEALVAILPGNQSTFVAVILRGTVHAYRARIGRATLDDRGQGAAREPRSHRGPARPTIWIVRAVSTPRCSDRSTAGCRASVICWWSRPGHCSRSRSAPW